MMIASKRTHVFTTLWSMG